MRATARGLLEVDPRNESVWIFLTRAYSELEMVEEANATWTEFNAPGFTVEAISLTGQEGGGAIIEGMVKNMEDGGVDPGTVIRLRFHLGGTDGTEVGSLEVTVQAPAPGQTSSFFGQFTEAVEVTGYSYEVINP